MRKITVCILSVFLTFLTVFFSSCEADTGKNEKNTVETEGILISHAGGAIYGLRYTNSLEALDNSYSVGHRFFEIDFNFTSDGELVLIHDFDSMGSRLFGTRKVLSLDEFHSAKCLLSLTMMDVYMLKDWMDTHTDAYIITDSKEENLKVINTLKEKLSPDSFSRIIPQAYNYDEYNALKESGIEKIILTTYAMTDSEDNIISFAIENKLFGLTVTKYFLESAGFEKIEKLASNGVRVYAHTVNELDYFEQWHAHGLYGIYTDYFEPRGFPYENLDQ